MAEDVGAAGEQYVRRALDHDAVAAAGLGVDGGHALAGGVEGEFCHTGELLFQLVFVVPLLLSGQDDGGLGGVTGTAAVRVQGGVGAEGADDQSQLLALGGGGPQVGDGHLVAGEGAGLVTTDNAGTA